MCHASNISHRLCTFLQITVRTGDGMASRLPVKLRKPHNFQHTEAALACCLRCGISDSSSNINGLVHGLKGELVVSARHRLVPTKSGTANRNRGAKRAGQTTARESIVGGNHETVSIEMLYCRVPLLVAFSIDKPGASAPGLLYV